MLVLMVWFCVCEYVCVLCLLCLLCVVCVRVKVVVFVGCLCVVFVCGSSRFLC